MKNKPTTDVQELRPVKLKHRLEYLALRIVEMLVILTPTILLGPLAHFLAIVAFYVFGYRREVAMDNLRTAFPEKSPAERRGIAFRSVKHLLLSFLEYIKLSRWDVKRLNSRVEIDNPENFAAVTDENSSRGALLVLGHFGNWEVAGARVASASNRVAAGVKKRQSNPLSERRISEMRQHWGMELIEMRGAVKRCLAVLKNGGTIGLVTDQDGGKKGIFIPFFGKPASTITGMAAMYLRYRPLMFFMSCVRIGPMRFRLLLEPVNLPEELPFDDESIRKVSIAFTAVLEKVIRQYPEQYLWVHKRWKTAPPEEQ